MNVPNEVKKTILPGRVEDKPADESTEAPAEEAGASDEAQDEPTNND